MTCSKCGAEVVTERRQVVPDDPDEPRDTTITRCTSCPYTLVRYTGID